MQNKSLSQTMSEMLDKLDTINQTASPLEEGPASKLAGNVFDFFKGLGKGGEKAAAKPRIDPTSSAGEMIAAAAGESTKKLSQLRKITPAELVAARAEGITIDEMLMRKFPDTFAKLEKDPSMLIKVNNEFIKAADEIMSAGERGPEWLRPQEDKHGKKSLALSALLHALIVLGLFVASKRDGSTAGSSSTTSATTLVDSEIPWTHLKLNASAYSGSSLKKDSMTDKWTVILPNGRRGGVVTDPSMVQEVEKIAAMTPEQRQAFKSQSEPVHQVELWDKVPDTVTPAADDTTIPKADIVIKKDNKPAKPATSSKKEKKKGTESDW